MTDPSYSASERNDGMIKDYKPLENDLWKPLLRYWLEHHRPDNQ
jgi:hypothetical protein